MSAIETFDLRKDRNFPAELILSSNQLRKTISSLAQNILFLRSINTASTVFTPPRIPNDEPVQQQQPTTNAIGKNTSGPRSGTPPQASKNSSFAGSNKQQQQHNQQQHPLFELAFSEEIENRSGGSSSANQHYSFVDTKSIDEIMNELILLSSSSNSNNNNNSKTGNNQNALGSYFSLSSSKSETKWKVRENHLEQLSLLAAHASSSSSSSASSPSDASDLFSVPCLAAKLLIIKVAVEQNRSSAAARGQSHVANNQNDVVVMSSTSTIPGLPLGSTTTTTTKTTTTSASNGSASSNGQGGGWFGNIVSATAGAFASAVVSATNTAVAAAVGTNNNNNNNANNLSAEDSSVFLKQVSSPFFGDGNSSANNSNNNFVVDEFAEKKRGLITKNVEVVEEWCIPIVILLPSEVQKLDRVIKRFKHMINAGVLNPKDSSGSDDDDDENAEEKNRMKKFQKLQNKRKAMLEAADREYFVNAAAMNSSAVTAEKDHHSNKNNNGGNNKRFDNSPSQFGNPTQSSAAFALGEKHIASSNNASPDPRLSGQNKNETATKKASSDSDDDAVLIDDDEVMDAELEQKKYKNKNENVNDTSTAANRGSEQRQTPQHQNSSNTNQPTTLLPQESLEILASMLEPDSISRVQRVLLWMQEQVCQCGTNTNSTPSSGFRRSSASSYELFENASKVIVSVSLGGLSSKEGKLVEPTSHNTGKAAGTRDSPSSTPTQTATTTTRSPSLQATNNNISGKATPPPALVTGNGWSLPKLW